MLHYLCLFIVCSNVNDYYIDMQVVMFQFTSYADLYNVPLRIILIYIMYVSGFMTYIIITPHVLPQKKRNRK